MSDEGEKTCPLCAEEMDLTDQQLKPCRCGYEVCVWCWHHIMEMAEKDETEGKCPACRTPYDKEKIVGTAASCERLAAGGGTEKKHKSQKTKPKTSESRKPLTSVRVIQRNLVYIVGLPFNLADDDLLQQKEYFGKYGKVLKVSISRNSTGSIQQFANNTCSVYITYAREDEAIRCIQSVHMFILDGRPLRACFGTTKYCHAWLRNAPCNNPDCLYLHEIGKQEDSFTKDDIVSAYSRVQQITGVTNNMQQGSGDALPPPTDNYCNNSSSVPRSHEVKSSINNSVSSTRGSPPSSSSGLPPGASWGARGAKSNPATGNTGSSNASTKEKPDTTNGLPVIPSIVSSSPQTSKLPNNTGKRHVTDEETHAKLTNSKMKASDTAKQHPGSNSKSTIQTPRSVTMDYHKTEDSKPLDTKSSADERPCSPSKHKEETSAADVNIEKLSTGISTIGIDKQPNGEYSEVFRPGGLTLDNFISHIDDSLQWDESGRNEEQSVASLAGNKEMCDLTSEVQALSKHNLTSETVDDFDNQRLRDAIVSQAPMPTSSPLHMLSNLRIPSQPQADSDFASSYLNPPSLYKGPGENVSINPPMGSLSSNGFLEHLMNHAFGHGNSLANGTQANYMGQFGNELTHVESRPALDVGENHIISNDSWSDPFTSQNLAKFFGENNKQESSSNLANSWTSQSSNHSRFSFARQEDSRNHLFDSGPSMGNSYSTNNTSFGQGFLENRDPYQDNRLNGPEFHHHRNMEFSNDFLGGTSGLSSSKLPVSRSQISAPPGFTAPSRPPPPGFTSHESLDFLKSGNQLHETSLHLGNPYQASHSGNINTANDIEFIDPAIMAVGKGRPPTGFHNSSNEMRSSFRVQAPGFENEFRLQSLMQISHPSHQIPTYNDVRQFSPSNNAYNFPLQSNNTTHLSNFSLQEPRNTVVSNGQWDGWSELQSTNDMNMGECLRNDRTGLANFYGGYEDSKFQMMNSSDLYNKSFGM